MKNMGPSAVMRHEHKMIKDLLKQIHEQVMDAMDSVSLEFELLQMLGQHNVKEENVLYPMIDQLTDSKQKEEIFSKMKDMKLVPRTCCCDLI